MEDYHNSAKRYERWKIITTQQNAGLMRTHESPRALVRQSEAKRNQAPQSEAKVCRRRRKCNLEKFSY